MGLLTIDTRDFEKVTKKLSEIKIGKGKEFRNTVNESALNIQREAKKACPVDTGRLRSSIRPVFFADGMAADVGTDVEYAANVEFATKPHMPPSGALSGWAKRQLGNEGAAYAVALKIKESGTVAKPFLFPAFEQERPKFERRLKSILRKAK